jgi:GNAT superfamily N-acetyltransferase
MDQSEGPVRRAQLDDLQPCLRIVRALPDFFTEDVPDKVQGDLESSGGWVAVEAGQVVGFVIVDRRSAQAAEILWIAVEPARRHIGHGTRLLDRVLGALRSDGVVLVEVKTLDRSAEYAPYEPTRAFWERNGFVQIDRIDEPPGWEPGNPAAVYVAALAPTR